MQIVPKGSKVTSMKLIKMIFHPTVLSTLFWISLGKRQEKETCLIMKGVGMKKSWAFSQSGTSGSKKFKKTKPKVILSLW